MGSPPLESRGPREPGEPVHAIDGADRENQPEQGDRTEDDSYHTGNIIVRYCSLDAKCSVSSLHMIVIERAWWGGSPKGVFRQRRRWRYDT